VDFGELTNQTRGMGHRIDVFSISVEKGMETFMLIVVVL
jgi:hypothetical protein